MSGIPYEHEREYVPFSRNFEDFPSYFSMDPRRGSTAHASR